MTGEPSETFLETPFLCILRKSSLAQQAQPLSLLRLLQSEPFGYPRANVAGKNFQVSQKSSDLRKIKTELPVDI